MKTGVYSVALSMVLCLLLGFSTYSNQSPMAADDSYKSLWKRIDSLERKSLPKSAREVAEQIFDKASSEKDDPNQIKSLIYILKYGLTLEEGATAKSFYEVEEKIKTANEPTRQILQSYLATFYWQYLQQNRYRYYNRTETLEFDNEDVMTWSLPQIHKKIQELYLASLENPKLLQSKKLNDYKEIIVEVKDFRDIRPTVYDLLANRAIDYFRNDESSITKPANTFVINEHNVFLPSGKFIKEKFKSEDPLAHEWHALKILQSLEDFHSSKGNTDALVISILNRMSYAHDKSVLNDKWKKYKEALETLNESFSQQPIGTSVSYELANMLRNKANEYDPHGNTDAKWYNKEAIEIAENATGKFPNSMGAKNCKRIIEDISHKQLSFTVEENDIANTLSRGLMSYKNINKVYAKIVQFTISEIEALEGKNYKDQYKAVNKSGIKEWTFNSPNDGDFHSHSFEFEIPELATGVYFLILSDNKSYSDKNGITAYSKLWKTNHYLIEKQTRDGATYGQLLHRETGEAKEGIDIKVYKQVSDKRRRYYEYVKTVKTEDGGYFTINAMGNYTQLKLEVIEGNDTFITYTNQNGNQRSKNTNNSNQTFLFTDRAIYRPGQTVYYKGIILNTDFGAKKQSLVKNQKTTTTLNDVNRQQVGTNEHTSNDYGSFHGSFKLPESGLTGSFTIQNTFGSKSISVEEYKRPKFEVKFDPIKEDYALNDKVTVKGKAKTFSGASIDNAEVRYSVKRNYNIPYWPWWWWRSYRWFPRTGEKMQITSGTAKTDAEGNFEISFDAQPDLSVDKKYKPIFNYTVEASVTDVTGENHEDEVTVNVGYVGLNVSLIVPESMDASDDAKFILNTVNLNGEFIPSEVSLKVLKLKAPERTLRKRLWGRPDQFIMDKEKYISKFPQDIYDNEEDYNLWEEESVAWEKTVTTSEKNQEIDLGAIDDWDDGKYRVELKTKDARGNEIELSHLTEVLNKNLQKVRENISIAHIPYKFSVEEGKDAELLVKTGFDNVHVFYEVNRDAKNVEKDHFILNKEQRIIDISPGADRYYQTFVHSHAVKYNRFYSFNKSINVIEPNDKLDFVYETFRDKLKPGQEEEWRIKIKGPKGDKVAAEMLATLYDASLDQFKEQSWNFSKRIFRDYNYVNFSTLSSDRLGRSRVLQPNRSYSQFYSRSYDQLNTFGFYVSAYHGGYYADEMMLESVVVQSKAAGVSVRGLGKRSKSAPAPMAADMAMDESAPIVNNYSSMTEPASTREVPGPPGAGTKKKSDFGDVPIRKNLQELAFFMPQLKTNSAGEVILSFTMPEALTRWKFMALAHDKDLNYAFSDKEIVTQKDLMITPNSPRFFREGDEIFFTAKVNNVSDKNIDGEAVLQLFDATTMKEIDAELGNVNTIQKFNSKAGQSAGFDWKLKIPKDIGAITYRVLAKSKKHSDGEENLVPVLTNRKLVTETLPMPVNSKETKDFRFDHFIDHGSSTIDDHRFTLEFTSNPAWYAVQALPYLMEYPYECSEQIFSRFYANSLATEIANSQPKLKEVFNQWKKEDAGALLSNLEKNQELKSILLEESPWLLDGQDETARKKRIALLFDLTKMAKEQSAALKKLQSYQKGDGGFPWFKGSRYSNRWITQHIISGMGKLDHLGVKDVRENPEVWNMLKRAIDYADHQILEDYQDILRYDRKLSDKNVNRTHIHYFYARSFFSDIPVKGVDKIAFTYFKKQARKYWADDSHYTRALNALYNHREGEKDVVIDIMKSIREHTIENEELGTYIKYNRGWNWYQAPIEQQAMMIEAFDEIEKDQAMVDGLKTWLLKQKQTQDWKTTKATVEAIYALLLRGTNWIAEDQQVSLNIGGQKVDPARDWDIKAEAGTGYIKHAWSGDDITADLGEVTVTNPNSTVTWGALYWQYFEDLDKIVQAETPLKLEKKLFKEIITETGEKIIPITETELKPGDRVIVRIELRVDRQMDYVHMKDMRSSGFEPVNVISKYKYQDGLGYYESTRDASTDFFFDRLTPGTYVFEYPLKVYHRGNFSNGITTIQCMYAPEFTSHSEGVRVVVE